VRKKREREIPEDMVGVEQHPEPVKEEQEDRGDDATTGGPPGTAPMTQQWLTTLLKMAKASYLMLLINYSV
jgi:hypothetical protein